MSTTTLDRRSRRKLQALWKPEYDALARFNAERGRGLVHESEIVQHMAEVQRDYDENYTPASQRVWSEGRTRKVWFG